MTDIEEVIARLAAKKVQRGSDAATVPGYLTARDVCRLFVGPEWSNPWIDGPTTTARRVIAENKIPLIETEPGHWQVAHTVN